MTTPSLAEVRTSTLESRALTDGRAFNALIRAISREVEPLPQFADRAAIRGMTPKQLRERGREIFRGEEGLKRLARATGLRVSTLRAYERVERNTEGRCAAQGHISDALARLVGHRIGLVYLQNFRGQSTNIGSSDHEDGGSYLHEDSRRIGSPTTGAVAPARGGEPQLPLLTLSEVTL